MTFTLVPDFQRENVYRAGDQLGLANNPAMSIEDCQAYVDKILKSRWWRNRSSITTIPVQNSPEPRTGEAKCHFNVQTLEIRDCVILVPALCHTKRLILHEMAHFLNFGVSGLSSHGPEFCAHYLDLSRHWLGRIEATKLRNHFKTNGVDYEPK